MEEEASMVGALSSYASNVISKETSDIEVDQKLPGLAYAAATENMTAKGERESEDDQEKRVSVCLGPKVFVSSLDMFDYFMRFLHSWGSNVSVNKFEQMVLSDLLTKGHSDPSNKIGAGIHSFQIRSHPEYKSRCFFIIRVDGTSVDFSFRKCVDRLLPLPDKMKPSDTITSGGNQKVNGNGRGGRGGRSGRGKRGVL